MKKLLSFILSIIYLCQSFASAQTSGTVKDRQAVIEEARYLKSIYKTEKAIELLSGLLSPEQFDEEVMNELAECHIQAGDLESAANMYSTLLMMNPESILYRIRMMSIAYRSKDYKASAEMGLSIIQRDTIPAIISLTGDSFNMANMPDSALAYYGMYMRLNPANPAVVSKAAKIHLARKEYDIVLDMAENYLQIDSTDMDIRGLQGLAYFQMGDFRKSEDVFQKMEDDGNDSYSVHIYLGQNQWRNKKHISALKELKTAWQIDSSDVNLAYSIGTIMREFGSDLNKVKPWFDRALDLITPDPEILGKIQREYALAYMKAEQFSNALDYYLKSWETDKSKYSVLSNIGYLYEQLKDWKKAEKYYLQYLNYGKPGSGGYKYVEESLAYVRQQMFMEE
ncbi:MAG: tetratricopeptide repeat protein [Candidatus Cryptobacteroides sp.]